MQNKGVFLSRCGIASFKEHCIIRNAISHHDRLRAVDLVNSWGLQTNIYMEASRAGPWPPDHLEDFGDQLEDSARESVFVQQKKWKFLSNGNGAFKKRQAADGLSFMEAFTLDRKFNI